MELAGAYFDAVYYCPHHPSAGEPPYRQVCPCRKPKPGMLWRAVEEFGVDIAKSFVIGDRYSDIELAHNAGAHSVFVLSGYGLGAYEHQRSQWKVQPEWVGGGGSSGSQPGRVGGGMTPAGRGLGPKPAFLPRGHGDQAVDPALPARRNRERSGFPCLPQ